VLPAEMLPKARPTVITVDYNHYARAHDLAKMAKIVIIPKTLLFNPPKTLFKLDEINLNQLNHIKTN